MCICFNIGASAGFHPSFLFDQRSTRQALNKNFAIEIIDQLYRIVFRSSIREKHALEFEVNDNILVGIYFNSINHSIGDVLSQLVGCSIIDKCLPAELHGVVVSFRFFAFGNNLIQPFFGIMPLLFENSMLLLEFGCIYTSLGIVSEETVCLAFQMLQFLAKRADFPFQRFQPVLTIGYNLATDIRVQNVVGIVVYCLVDNFGQH